MFVDRVQVLSRLCVESKLDVDCNDAMVVLFLVISAMCPSLLQEYNLHQDLISLRSGPF